MTMTFEPFTPADAPEQGGYDGRRRAEQREESPRWAGGEPWQEPPGYGRPRERVEWADPGGVETSWSEARPEARGWTEQPRWRAEFSPSGAVEEPEPVRRTRGGFR